MNQEVMKAVPAPDPLYLSWEAYKVTDGYRDRFKWAAFTQHRDGALWGTYLEGWNDSRAYFECALADHLAAQPADSGVKTLCVGMLLGSFLSVVAGWGVTALS